MADDFYVAGDTVTFFILFFSFYIKQMAGRLFRVDQPFDVLFS